MAFRVKQTSEADQDLDGILEWLVEQQAGEAGFQWFHKLKEALLSLSEMPHRYSLAPENKGFPFEVRQLIYGRSPIGTECCSLLMPAQ